MWIIICIFIQSLKGVPAKYYVYLSDEIGKLQISVSVWGEVESPGIYSIPDGTDIITLLTLTGGPKETADLSNIKIISITGEKNTFTVNLNKLLQKGEIDNPYKLKPGDIIQIKKNRYSKIKDFTQFIGQISLLIGMGFQLYNIYLLWKEK